LRRLTTSAASASDSTSSAMMTSGLPLREVCSSSGIISRTFEIFFSWISTRAFSNCASIDFGSVMKYGDT